MRSQKSYVGNIVDTVKTVLDGMAVTFSHFVRKPFTVQYPDRTAIRVQDTLPFRYRGILEVDLEICTGCLACERACPIDCIVIDAVKDNVTDEETRDRIRRSILDALPQATDDGVSDGGDESLQ